jgi:hypothetical protein
VIILFTTLVLGGGTMPLMKYLERRQRLSQSAREGRRKRRKEITLSKAKEVSFRWTCLEPGLPDFHWSKQIWMFGLKINHLATPHL